MFEGDAGNKLPPTANRIIRNTNQRVQRGTKRPFGKRKTTRKGRIVIPICVLTDTFVQP